MPAGRTTCSNRLWINFATGRAGIIQLFCCQKKPHTVNAGRQVRQLQPHQNNGFQMSCQWCLNTNLETAKQVANVWMLEKSYHSVMHNNKAVAQTECEIWACLKIWFARIALPFYVWINEPHQWTLVRLELLNAIGMGLYSTEEWIIQTAGFQQTHAQTHTLYIYNINKKVNK